MPQLRKLALTSLFVIATVSCGSDGGDDDVASGGIGGTGISSGSISGFGSIFVNGFEFDIGGIPITVDDLPGAEADLELGQVVTVTTSIDSSGTNTATSVVFDDSLDGPISDVPQADADGLTKTFTVLGTTVVVDVDSTVFSASVPGFNFDAIAKDDVVQISGFFDENDVLSATHIEKKGVFTPGLSVEAKGTIRNLDTGNQMFNVRALTVHYDGATDLTDLPGGLMNSLFVEVKGTLQTDGSVVATEIEFEGITGDVDAASVEGFITNFTGVNDFTISSANGPVHVDASGAIFAPVGLVLAVSLEMEVEGPIVNGTLFARSVELRSALVKLETTVSAVDVPDMSSPQVGSVTLEFPGSQTKTVLVDTRTRMEDERDDLSPFVLTDIGAGDFLRVKAREDGNGDLVAKEIKRTDPRDVVLQGPAQVPPTGGTDWNGTVSILDITFQTDNNTKFEDLNDVTTTGNDFFTNVADGELIKAKDKDPADGIADEVEAEEMKTGGDDDDGTGD